MTAIDQLTQFKKEFEVVLGKFIRVKKQEAERLDEKYAAFVDILEDFTMRGGKRIRPAFMYFGYLACGGTNKEEILKAARAVELLQSFLLIHDDLVDRSNMRRGKPTAHRMFEKEYEKLGLSGGKEHFGQSMAIICGDLAHMFAYEALLSADFPTSNLDRARKLFDKIMFETAYGWYQEMLNTMSNRIDEADVLRTISYVSATYTVIGPVELGAILAGASENQLAILEEYGMKLGTAFQIQDDILGMFGEDKEVGKPVNSDMVEGKKTLLYTRLVDRLTEVEKKKFLSVYGKSKVMADLEWVRGLMRSLGVLDEVKEEARKLAREAVALLDEKIFSSEGGEFLRGIGGYLVERKV